MSLNCNRYFINFENTKVEISKLKLFYRHYLFMMNLESAFQVSNFNANTTNSFDMKIDFDDDLLTDEVRPTNRKRSAEEIMKCAKHLKTQKNMTSAGKTS